MTGAERVPEQTLVSVSPAVLLSPPRQQSTRQHVPGNCILFKLSDFKSLPQKLFAFRGLIFCPLPSTVTHPVLTHQRLPPVDIPCSYGHLQTYSSDSNSLPLTKLPSTSSLSLTSDPLRSPLSPGTLLSEIAQLSRETDLIRAQLSQPKGLGSGVREPLDSGNERRSLSCSSAGRVTPQNFGERTSESSCKERRSQDVQTPEAEQVTQQVRFKGLFEAV